MGIQCSSATFKNEIKHTETFPFDWMFSTPSFVYQMLFLLLEEKMDVEELVREHFFICDKRANMNGEENYYTCDQGFALYNKKYNVIFPHDTHVSLEKYIRRFERLKNIILNTTEDICFLYTSQSSLLQGNFTIDGNSVITDVYSNLTKIYNLLGKFRNNYKVFVFDAIQNEPLELLHENIILYKLNKCTHWNNLVEQMRAYKQYIK